MGLLHVYGWTGVLLAAAFLLSSVWMAALAVLQLHPTEVANYLMDTTHLDYGDFWILLRADDIIAVPAAVLLASFSLGYLGLVVLMLFHSRKRSRDAFRIHRASERQRSITPIVPSAASTRKLSLQVRTSYRQLHSAVGSSNASRVIRPADYRRRMWHHIRRDILSNIKLDDSPLFALPKLILQTTALVRFLEDGLPTAVIFSYAALLLVNWMITSYCTITRQVDPRLMIVRVFYSFDLFFAVLAPLQVLLYAYSHFEFNRSEFATRSKTFSTANFDRTARLFADPTSVSRFRIAFKLLQISTLPNLGIKVVLNAFAILRWARVISLVGRTEAGATVAPATDEINCRPRRRRRREWCLLGLAFFGLGGAVFIYTIVAVASTWHVCERFVQCQVPSYHWNVGETQCSCLVFVDRQTRVTTFAEWQDPVDTSTNLAALAGAGYLKIVQIVNRRVEVLPEELGKCRNLEQLTLLYTKTTTIPDWAKAFTNLEYLHIEGDLMNRTLTRLPSDIFNNMPRLLFLHLGTLTKVPTIPNLTRLPRLKYLLFAMLHSVTEIPSLDGLTNLQQLSIIDAIQVYALPSTKTLKKLHVYTVSSRMPVCCNGFITGVCDLTHFSCLDRTASGEPLVRCTRDRITPADFTTLMTTEGSVCDTSQKFDLKDVRPTVASVDLACGGVMYRQCTLNGSPGICFPARMMPISCQLNTVFQSMRRLQIELQVGEPCDPKRSCVRKAPMAEDAEPSNDGVDAAHVAPIVDVDTQLTDAIVKTDLPGAADVDNTTGAAAVKGTKTEASGGAHVNTAHPHPRSRSGFLHFYGWMGVPMVVIFLLSAMWTIMLAVIQQAPTYIANWLMDTEMFDQGEFWLLPKPDNGISVPATLLLALFAVGYIALVFLMAFPDKLMRRSASAVVKADTASRLGSVRMFAAKIRGHQASEAGSHKTRRHSRTIPPGWTKARLRYELLSPYGLLRHYYNPLLDLPKLVFQTTTLFTYLHNGFPIAIIAIYTSLLYINWLISSYRYQRELPDPHFVLSRLFYSFDLFFAVFAPLEVLTYARYNFEFDRAAFAVRLETLPPGQFETTARLFADPTEVSLFRIAFHYLQFTDGPSLGIKSALNVLSIFKWWRTIVHLVHNAYEPPTQRTSIVSGSVEHEKATKLQRRQRIQNAIIASIFFLAGSAAFAHSIGAVVSTKHICESFEQCKVPSYQWNVGQKYCSCIVFVDRHPGVKTVAEWENPPDTSDNLAALAHTGHLKIIQIINRKVPTLPDELRDCHHLEQLILLYTKIRAIPDWTKEFDKLEYLHIQGDLTATQLTYLPPDLFHNMPHLNFLHLGSHIKLTTLPDLSKLHKLAYLTFGMLHSVTELPSLDGLVGLHRFSIIDLIKLPKMPSTSKLKKLKAISILSRNPMCCNGFLTQPCNLTDFSCKDRTSEGESLVQCSSDHIPSEEITHLHTLGGSICPGGYSFDLKNNRQTLVNTDKACGGVKYKACKLGTLSGICYPNLMQTISCQINAGLVNMRKLEIERGVGEPCDPVEETWLGCKA